MNLLKKDLTTICKAWLSKRNNQINSKLLSVASFVDIIKDSSIIQIRSKAAQIYTGWLGFLGGNRVCGDDLSDASCDQGCVEQLSVLLKNICSL